jgi:hypothetical protein
MIIMLNIHPIRYTATVDHSSASTQTRDDVRHNTLAIGAMRGTCNALHL